MKKWFIAPVLLLAACAPTQWTPGPGTNAADFGRASGQCKLVSMGAATGPGFVAASGSPAFVGTAVGVSILASAIGSAVRQKQAFDACMEASGFVVAVAPAAAQ